MQDRARELRKELTPAEKKLWAHLRMGQLDGWQWRKKHAVGTYIVDFFCAKAKLVIEVDGDTHADPDQAAYDAERTRWLNEQKAIGCCVLPMPRSSDRSKPCWKEFKRR